MTQHPNSEHRDLHRVEEIKVITGTPTFLDHAKEPSGSKDGSQAVPGLVPSVRHRQTTQINGRDALPAWGQSKSCTRIKTPGQNGNTQGIPRMLRKGNAVPTEPQEINT